MTDPRYRTYSDLTLDELARPRKHEYCCTQTEKERPKDYHSQICSRSEKRD